MDCIRNNKNMDTYSSKYLNLKYLHASGLFGRRLNKRFSVILLVAFLTSFTTLSYSQDSEPDILEIREQLEGWEKAWNEGDVEAVANYYDKDADRTFAHGTVTTGRTAIREMYEKNLDAALPEGIEQTLSLEILSIRIISTDVAVADYKYRATGIPIAADLVVQGRSTVVMVKRDDKWLRTAQRNWIPTTPDCMRLCLESIPGYPPQVKH